MTYQFTYESKNPPVAGLGFAAIRDMASAIKNNSDAIVHARFVYTYGASQVGVTNASWSTKVSPRTSKDGRQLTLFSFTPEEHLWEFQSAICAAE